jgi:mycothiol synthase
MTVEERLSMMRVPEYDPELDLLAIAPDGKFAAYCTCAISQTENVNTGRNEGYIDTIATHPDFQRRGLARALLLTGLRLLKERGMDTAVLGTSSENMAMQPAAGAVGFDMQSTTLWFAKPIPEC